MPGFPERGGGSVSKEITGKQASTAFFLLTKQSYFAPSEPLSLSLSLAMYLDRYKFMK